MDEVGFHREGAAFDLVFTGYMEMELFQGVGAAVHAEGIAAFRVVDLNGVAVVFHVNRARLVIDFDGRQFAGDGFGDVDGGLVLPVEHKRNSSDRLPQLSGESCPV